MIVGRYAPSPTGSLHQGNLRTALAAWLSARSRGGRFLLRIEDLDGPRCRAEFESRQLTDLRTLGLDWDEEPIRQSARADVYHSIFLSLRTRRLVYPCFCSRKEIAEALSAPHGSGAACYPGTCGRLAHHEAERRAATEQHAWRLRVDECPPQFFDGFQGPVAIDLRSDGGDFVVLRADGLFAYQFACAVDDALSGVTEVLRGRDLLDSGQRQSYLLSCLRLPVPRYVHIPLMLNAEGTRLAKRIGSEDLSGICARGYSAAAVRCYLAWTLGVAEPGETPSLPEMAKRWSLAKVPREDVRFREEELRPWG